MSASRAWQRTIGSSIGRAAVLLAALAGLFAMHGLSEHGMASHTAIDAPMSTMTGSSDPHPTANLRVGPHLGTTLGDVGTAMGICLAVLLAAGMWWQRRAAERRIIRLSGLLAVTSVIAARARAPDPPDLIRLSIQLC